MTTMNPPPSIPLDPQITSNKGENPFAPFFLKTSAFAHDILNVKGPLFEPFYVDSDVEELKKPTNLKMVNFLVRFLTDHFIFKSIIDKKKSDLYFFNTTTNYYNYISESAFCGEIDEIFQGTPNLMGRYTNIIGNEIYTRVCNRNVCPDEDLDNYPHLLPFLNGIYNFDTQEFTQNTPDNFITKTLPYDRNDSLNCELFKKTLEEILPDPVSRKIVLTYLSYCLSGSIKLQIGQIWKGKKNNGKTKLGEFFQKLMGDLSSAVPFDDFITEKGAIVWTRGKRLNMSGEIGGSTITKRAVNLFKRIITESFLNGRGAYGRRQSWVNACKFIFPTNDLPNPRKCKKAFFRRWQFVFFKEDFTGREDRTIFDRIYDTEGSAVISYLLTFVPFWDELLVNDADLVEQIWKNDTLSSYVFITEMCEFNRTYKITTSELYQTYVKWCLNQDENAVDYNDFKDDLNQEGISSVRLRNPEEKDKSDNREYYFVGIKLKEDNPKKMSDDKINDWFEDVEKSQAELTPEPEKPDNSEFEDTCKGKILEQLKNLHETHKDVSFFDSEDIWEPLHTWMDMKNFQEMIVKLSKTGKVEVSEFGIRMKK